MPNYKKLSYRALCLILALVMALSLAACSSREPDEEESATLISDGPVPEMSIPAPEVSVSDELPEDYPEVQDSIEEWKAINDETVGWLSVPGTEISDVIVCRMDPADYNQYYYRRNAKQEEDFHGCFYADCRTNFDGTINGLSRNTTIYGHSIEIPDDPDGILFSQLKRYWKEDFARENPYLYFSIDGTDMVWEIFAAFYTNKLYDDKVNDYINPLDGYTDTEIQAWLDRSMDRSEYIYDVDVSPDDKFLTLSTCLYHLSNGDYPNDYRWVVVAKLVQDGEYKEEASLTVNPNPMSPDKQN